MTFHEAAKRALDKLKVEGPVGWRDPSMFPVFIECFEELIEYIQLDPRSQGGVATDILTPAPGRKYRLLVFHPVLDPAEEQTELGQRAVVQEAVERFEKSTLIKFPVYHHASAYRCFGRD